MRILIANDDGIDAPGLALAERAAARLTDDIWTVAPDAKRTAAGSSLTLARPLTMRRRGERRWSCSGTPADCVVTAMTWLLRGAPPDLVLAGVNDGPNVAEDIAYSGTLGIAREASFWGLPAIGLSRVKNAEARPGDADWLAGLLAALWTGRDGWRLEGHWLSVNLPSRLPAPVVPTRIGRDKIAARAEVVRGEGDTVELIVPRGRAQASTPGDENDLLGRGSGTISRLCWFGGTPLPEAVFRGL